MSNSELKPFGPNIWVVEQSSNYLGIPFGVRMTVIRLANRQLALHSVIACNIQTVTAIESLGDINHLIVPNLEHTRFLNEWRQRYPHAHLYAPATSAIKQPVSLPLTDSELLSLAINGMPRLQESVFFHPESRTLILTDLAFNLGGEMSLWAKCFLKLNGAYGHFTPSRLLKSLVKDSPAFNASIQQITQWDFERIIISHGAPITEDGKKRFLKAFEWAL